MNKEDWSREDARMGEYSSKSLLDFAASAGLDNIKKLSHASADSHFEIKTYSLFEKAVHREWDEFFELAPDHTNEACIVVATRSRIPLELQSLGTSRETANASDTALYYARVPPGKFRASRIRV